MKVGVLALQGGFQKHQDFLTGLGAKSLLVKKISELDGLAGLIIPGGESTTLLKLLGSEFKSAIRDFANSGRKLFTTCAGTILVAKTVTNPPQESLALIDIDVERNSYGRQIDSFVTTELKCETTALKSIEEAIFIRAPKIIRTGGNVEILATLNSDPVLVKNQNILAASFHPELSDISKPEIHRYFLSLL